ncbi:ChbG/HpnK family deacetylase [Nitratireductor sp. ZSWI3]|uniref:ChbG/HpnK family deacetylase n=1 Tax=Nitratireductor sp. ZSWI3 TaxID=2966359 RepID=UPI00214F7443|nr:ChbG/HpnK family deacetylase [Nitratireductor sp. ZSWI3]MCR4268973.1 ChbG/HpnK family deacetylase [Nitratireductor sp. ZSWI3]
MAEERRTAWLIADDYGLSPGVSAGIRSLLERRRLSGTGCMTLFDDWEEQAAALAATGTRAAIGMHLTLTDFPALSTGETMPGLRRLIAACTHGERQAVAAEADAQLDRFRAAFGRDPAFIDGHQHVHFLQPVRRWIAARFADRPAEARPWLRGAPTLRAAPAGMTAKVTLARLLARGFDTQMRRGDFLVRGPLCGFYDWRRQGAFTAALPLFLEKAPDESLIMCHPGKVDATLRARDAFTNAREEELAALGAADLTGRLERAGIAWAGIRS